MVWIANFRARRNSKFPHQTHPVKGHFCLSSWLEDSIGRVEKKSSPPYSQSLHLVLNWMIRSTGGEKGKEPDTATNNTVGLGVENQKEQGKGKTLGIYRKLSLKKERPLTKSKGKLWAW